MEGGGVNIRDVVERGKRFCKGVVTVIKNCMYAHIQLMQHISVLCGHIYMQVLTVCR